MASHSIRVILAAAVAVVLQVHVTQAWASTPPSGAVSPSGTTTSFTGGPFDFTNQTGAPYEPPAPPVSPVCADPASPCDDFALTIAIPPSDTTIYFITANLNF